MPATTLTLTADCDRRLVATEVASQRTIEWVVTAPETPLRTDRAPLNLALILDRSGSMQGDKLRYVQQAACHVLDTLDERDRIAVVAYDDQVTLLSIGDRKVLKAFATGNEPDGMAWVPRTRGKPR